METTVTSGGQVTQTGPAKTAGPTFQVQDSIVHPDYGAGVVMEIKERHALGPRKRYYSIELLGQPGTTVMVAVDREKSVGLRRPTSQEGLGRLWRILRAEPGVLPTDHKERYAVIEDRFKDGDFFQIAEAVRDLAWRREEKQHLTSVGKQLYETGLGFLASELAIIQGGDVHAAETLISDKLLANIARAVA